MERSSRSTPQRLASGAMDLVFLAVPENAAAELAPPLVDAGVRVIDLSGAFRIRDNATRARWYPATKTLPSGAAYGLTEHYRDDVRRATLVANPGCYPTGALLATASARQSRPPRSLWRCGRRREVRHLGRRPRAERSHALLGESRIGRRVRRPRASSRRRDGTGDRRHGHVRAAPRAPGSRDSRDDLSARRRQARRPSRLLMRSTRRIATSRSSG